jgi:hypothetical protein
MSKLTGLKDVDREVLKYLTDKDLLVACSVDKRMLNEVCDDGFFRRRLSKYPGIEKYKKENESWKQFFLRFVYYTSKMWENYKFQYTEGNFKRQYDVLKRYKKDVLLQYSAREGILPLVKYSLQQEANIHTVDDFALRYASMYGYIDTVKYLVEQGANIHADNDDALRTASLNGNLEIVKYLVEHGADIHAKEDFALRWTSINGHLDVVKYLVEQGANVYAKNDEAFRTKHIDILKYLKSLN